MRSGVRCGRATLVVHLDPSGAPLDGPPLVGFVVPKAVGGAVVRNHVKRRLRSLVAGRVSTLPGGSRVVVRALPPAASCSYDALADDLEAALRIARRRADGRR